MIAYDCGAILAAASASGKRAWRFPECGEAYFSFSFQSCVFKHRRRKNRQLASTKKLCLDAKVDSAAVAMALERETAHGISRPIFAEHVMDGYRASQRRRQRAGAVHDRANSSLLYR